MALLLILLVSSMFVPSVKDTWNKGTEFVGDLLDDGQINNSGSTSKNGHMGLSFIIEWEDGTGKVVGADYPVLWSPLDINVEDKPLEKIDIIITAQIPKNVTPSSWKTTVYHQIELYKGTETTPKMSSTATLTKQGTSWEKTVWGNRETKKIANTTLQAAQIDSVVQQYGDGEWHLQVNIDVQLEVTSEGLQKTYEASAPSGGITFTYSDGMPASLTVKPQTVPFSLVRSQEAY